MKKLSILLVVLVLAFVSCKDDSISARDKRETKQKSEENFEPTLNFEYDGSSYWYVVAEKKDKGYKLSNVVKQDHRHFSLIEAKEDFNGGVFIVNFIQVSKETYEEQQ